MSSDIALIKSASALARHAATVHKTAGQNIAQADTPGYRALEVSPFNLRAAGNRPEIQVAEGRPAAPNGNTVALSDEMLTAASAKLQHETALGIYRKALDLMRLSLGRRS